MIISRGRAYIFVHIPKTGGTSMARALEARAMKDDILIGDTPKSVKRRQRLKTLNAAGRLWKHSTLADIDGVISAQEIAQMFVFTLVRNPWDRAVSYYHWLRKQGFDHPAVALAQSLDFEGFLRHAHTIKSLSTTPAGHYVTDATGTERCSAFLRLEHLNEDIGRVEDHLGFRLILERHNTSERSVDYRKYYDDSLAELLGKVCEVDIKRFGYSF